MKVSKYLRRGAPRNETKEEADLKIKRERKRAGPCGGVLNIQKEAGNRVLTKNPKDRLEFFDLRAA
jgi:hypothetical protein